MKAVLTGCKERVWQAPPSIELDEVVNGSWEVKMSVTSDQLFAELCGERQHKKEKKLRRERTLNSRLFRAASDNTTRTS
jgi:hypothetical protein